VTRIVICGGPRTGKTTLSTSLGIARVRHTDDVMDLGWSEASAEVATWFDEPGPWVIEGVAVGRALRKWLAANEGKPCDVVYYLDEALESLGGKVGRATMAAGCWTVWKEIREALEDRGVETRVGSAPDIMTRRSA
jgi:KaiC/GvpD/RAD55 family RecA-like ATPase